MMPHNANNGIMAPPILLDWFDSFSSSAGNNNPSWNDHNNIHWGGEDQSTSSLSNAEIGILGAEGHLIVYGADDEFLDMLLPTTFVEAARGHGQAVMCNARIGYNHSYHFVLAHVDDHVRFHGARLRWKLTLGQLRNA
ncbi:hypothetical protein ACHAW5_003980 [Stephanodiscus triporus]|uniref:Uncharacterized protein n=1 Tax=Stephanodiscus triporus TaxID=2934178 RepID=A0ABD3QRC9_9STRA